MLRLVKGVMKLLVAYLCLSFVYTYSYSVLNSSYVQERENMQLEEMDKIKNSLPISFEQVGSFIIRRHITRIANERYQYDAAQTAVEDIFKKIMEENGWRFIEAEKYRRVERTILIFKKEGYEGKIDFFEKNQFRITLTTDDIYNRLNW